MQVLILAAGQGTRMKSSLPKVLHDVAGYPMIHHIIHTVASLNPSEIGVVLHPSHQEVRSYLQAHLAHLPLVFFEQPQARGTGHAVQCAHEFYQKEGRTLILCGDTPLITSETLQKLCSIQDTPLALIAMRADATRGYGRCHTNTMGHVTRIVEAQEYPSEQDNALYNAGVYWMENSSLRRFLPLLVPSSVTQELYLTDVVQLAAQDHQACRWVEGEEEQFIGINRRSDLAEAERIVQKRLRRQAMDQGCTLIDPDTVYFSLDTVLEEDIWIGPSVFLGPQVKVGRGARLLGFCVIHETIIGRHVQIGPFVHLRPGTVLKDRVKIGNFVELKNTTMDEQAKANHLSYLGDALIGARTNIGAGTITCNYDGIHKHVTQIGTDVMVGSNTALVAPVHIGDGAYLGAGSVITQDVPSQDLAIARGVQRNIAQGAETFRKKHTPQDSS